MTDNLTQFSGAGLDSVWAGLVDSTGSFIGSASPLANGADSGGYVVPGPQTGEIQIPELERVNVLGADGKIASFLFESDTETAINIQAGALDVDMAMASQGSDVETVNNWEIGVLRPAIRTPQTLWLVMNSRAKSQASGSLNNPGFIVHMIKVELSYQGATGLSNKTPHTHNFTGVVQQSDVYPWGATAAHGPADGFFFWSANRVRLHALRGDATEDTIVFPSTLIEASDRVNVFNDGTALTYTTDFTITTQTLTFESGSVPGAGELVVAAYEYTTL